MGFLTSALNPKMAAFLSVCVPAVLGPRARVAVRTKLALGVHANRRELFRQSADHLFRRQDLSLVLYPSDMADPAKICNGRRTRRTRRTDGA